MKKLSFLVGALALSTAVFAQKPAEGEGKMSLEGQLNMMGIFGLTEFDAPSIRFRYFVQDNIAARVTLGINSTSNTYNGIENLDGTGATGTIETKNGGWNLGIGGEYHFAGTEKLSPYGGLDIMLGGGSMTESRTLADPISDINGNTIGAAYNIESTSMESESKTSMFGVNLVGGADYYFAQHFYIGFELGWGWSSMTWKEGTTTTVTTPVGGTAVTGNGVTPERKSSSLSNNSVAGFRVGWRF